MAKTFLLSTVGAGTTSISDLGGRSFTHPVVSLDLALEYTLEELRDSIDLRAAIQASTYTVSFDGVAITTDVLFDEYMVDFDHKQTKQNTDDIAALNLTGLKTWSYTFGEDKTIKGDRYIKTSNGVFSNLSPYITPLGSILYGVSVKSKNAVAVTYDIIIEDDGVAAYTASVAAGDSFSIGNLSVSVGGGSEIAVKADHNGDDIRDLTVTLYFEEV
tara:strand:+ start:2007 stop:2654 length:648 start_codon:yes stop_codon:yes gene_type:complete